MAQTPFYVAALSINGTIYPIRPNASLICPKNWNVPAVVGNYWAFNYGDGLRMPVLDCSIFVFDRSANSIFALAVLQSFITRSADASHDTTDLGDIVLYDGRSTVTMNHCKLESFTISSAVGEDIVFNCRFVGAGLTVNDSATNPFSGGAVTPSWSTDSPPAKLLRFNSVNITNPAGCTVWGFTLGLQHNHTPNLCLNGTQFPTEINAGMLGCTLSLTMQNTSGNPIADNGSVSIVLGYGATNAAVTRTIVLQNVLNNNPNDRVISVPRIMRTYNYVCLGASGLGNITSSTYAAPIKIT